MLEMVFLAAFAIAAATIGWTYFLALICIGLDPQLTPLQKFGQLLVVMLLPLVGPVLVLYIVNTHSPEVIARFYVPWPFARIVRGK